MIFARSASRRGETDQHTLSLPRLMKNEVNAKLAACSTPHRLAAAAAQAILDRGGNAVDAAVAATLALCVVVPSNVGIAGYGGSMIVYLAEKNETFVLDFDSRCPLKYDPELYRDPKVALYGYLAVSVPGVVAGLAQALRDFGTMSFADAAEPAEKIAREGFSLDTKLKRQLEDWKGRTDPVSLRAHFANGVIPEAQQTWVQKDLADLIHRLRIEGPEALYHGDIPKRIVKQIRDHGGILSEEDFHGYEPKIVEPLRINYRGYEIVTAPPPSGGLTSLEILKILEQFDVAAMEPWGAPYLHLVAEAIKIGWADRLKYIGDPDVVDIPIAKMLSKEWAAEQAKRIPLDAATHPVSAGDDLGVHTINVCAVDHQRNAVSLTATQGQLFGSQVVIEGLGLVIGHGISRFDFTPGSPNGPAAGKRMQHNMTPTIIMRDGKPYRVFGMPGGPKIVTVASQLVVNSIDFKKSPGEAIMAPRVHCEGAEPLLITNNAKDAMDKLEAMGHRLQKEQTVGGPANMIEIGADGLVAASGNGANAIASV
jgi:gamma-glutamyltranspeptidase/glutathione hydrolase